jgi:adenylosuccinate lyase
MLTVIDRIELRVINPSVSATRKGVPPSYTGNDRESGHRIPHPKRQPSRHLRQAVEESAGLDAALHIEQLAQRRAHGEIFCDKTIEPTLARFGREVESLVEQTVDHGPLGQKTRK